MTRARLTPSALFGVGMLALAATGCGSSSSSSSTTSSSSAASSSAAASSSETTSASSAGSGGGGLACLVGSWKSESTTGTVAVLDNAQFSGGAGETLVITSDGMYTDDYTNAQPVTGHSTTGGGHNYVVTTTGKGTGTVAATGNQVTITPDSSAAAVTQTVTADGQTIQTSHPTKQTATFDCTAGQSFTVTDSNGLTTKYVAS